MSCSLLTSSLPDFSIQKQDSTQIQNVLANIANTASFAKRLESGLSVAAQGKFIPCIADCWTGDIFFAFPYLISAFTHRFFQKILYLFLTIQSFVLMRFKTSFPAALRRSCQCLILPIYPQMPEFFAFPKERGEDKRKGGNVHNEKNGSANLISGS